MVEHQELPVKETYLHFHLLKEIQEGQIQMVKLVVVELVDQEARHRGVVEQQQLY